MAHRNKIAFLGVVVLAFTTKILFASELSEEHFFDTSAVRTSITSSYTDTVDFKTLNGIFHFSFEFSPKNISKSFMPSVYDYSDLEKWWVNVSEIFTNKIIKRIMELDEKWETKEVTDLPHFASMIQLYALGNKGALKLSLSHEEGGLPGYARRFTSLEDTFGTLKNRFVQGIKENAEEYENHIFQKRIVPFLYM